jgi:hypothetical protein
VVEQLNRVAKAYDLTELLERRGEPWDRLRAATPKEREVLVAGMVAALRESTDLEVQARSRAILKGTRVSGRGAPDPWVEKRVRDLGSEDAGVRDTATRDLTDYRWFLSRVKP